MTTPSAVSNVGNTPDALSGIGRSRARGPRRNRLVWWIVLFVGITYFVLPLIATFQFSMGMLVPFKAYTNTFSDPKFWWGLLYSGVCAILTILASTLLIVPTAYWVRLKVPRARPIIESITLPPGKFHHSDHLSPVSLRRACVQRERSATGASRR